MPIPPQWYGGDVQIYILVQVRSTHTGQSIFVISLLNYIPALLLRAPRLSQDLGQVIRWPTLVLAVVER